MTLNPIPPQAYTKETLQKAYSWLLKQSPEIKEMARDQEILVSLYLKAQRNGEESLDRPSVQNFRHELKNLAVMMSDFTGAEKQAPAQAPATQTYASPATAHQHMPRQATPAASSQTPAVAPTATPPAPASTLNSAGFDALTLERIQAVQKRFNLSSENEALRLLVSIGFEKTQGF